MENALTDLRESITDLGPPKPLGKAEPSLAL